MKCACVYIVHTCMYTYMFFLSANAVSSAVIFVVDAKRAVSSVVTLPSSVFKDAPMPPTFVILRADISISPTHWMVHSLHWMVLQKHTSSMQFRCRE